MDLKQAMIDSLNERISVLENREKAKELQKEKIINHFKLAWALIWKLVIVLIIVFSIRWICQIFEVDFGTWLSVLIGLIGLAGMIKDWFTNDLKKYK